MSCYGECVELGTGAHIIQGKTVGAYSVVGAGAVVIRDIPECCTAVGNPAKPLRKRFDDDLIGLLLKFKWWDKSIEEINSLIPILTCSELEKVKNEIEARL